MENFEIEAIGKHEILSLINYLDEIIVGSYKPSLGLCSALAQKQSFLPEALLLKTFINNEVSIGKYPCNIFPIQKSLSYIIYRAEGTLYDTTKEHGKKRRQICLDYRNFLIKNIPQLNSFGIYERVLIPKVKNRSLISDLELLVESPKKFQVKISKDTHVLRNMYYDGFCRVMFHLMYSCFYWKNAYKVNSGKQGAFQLKILEIFNSYKPEFKLHFIEHPTLTPTAAYLDTTVPKWDYRTTYGKNRREFIKGFIAYLEARVFCVENF